MIMTTDKLRQYIDTDMSDELLMDRLSAAELMIRRYTNNNFQVRGYRRTADITGGSFVCCEEVPYIPGDTVQVSESKFNLGLFTVESTERKMFNVCESVMDEKNVLCTKIVYPKDVQMGVVNMVTWDINNRSKVGIQSETLGRHSVTYFNMDGDNSLMGYPKSLIGFLRPYMKARF